MVIKNREIILKKYFFHTYQVNAEIFCRGDSLKSNGFSCHSCL